MMTNSQIKKLKSIVDKGSCHHLMCMQCPLDEMYLCNILCAPGDQVILAKELLDKAVSDILEVNDEPSGYSQKDNR